MNKPRKEDPLAEQQFYEFSLNYRSFYILYCGNMNLLNTADIAMMPCQRYKWGYN